MRLMHVQLSVPGIHNVGNCLSAIVTALLMGIRPEVIVPAMRAGKRCIIAAHGNSLRALVKYLDNMSDEEIISLNIPTGVPLVYEFDDDLNVTGHYYLGDQEALKAAMEAVANQGKKK